MDLRIKGFGDLDISEIRDGGFRDLGTYYGISHLKDINTFFIQIYL